MDRQHEVGVELREQHEARSHAHGKGEAQREAVRVEHGQHRVDDASGTALHRRHPGARLARVHEQVEVGEGRPLGVARRAARVLDEGHVVDGRPEDLGLDRLRLQQLFPRNRVVHVRGEGRARLLGLRDGQAQQGARRERHGARHVDGDEVLDGDILGEGLDGRHDVVPGDDGLRSVVFELVPQLARRVKRVVLDDDAAETQHRVERDDVLRAVRENERDGVALLHAEQAQALGGAIDLLAHLGVGGLRAEELEGDGLRELLDRRADEVVERARGQVDIVGHTLGVRGEPGAWGRDAHAAPSNMLVTDPSSKTSWIARGEEGRDGQDRQAVPAASRREREGCR